MVIGSLAVAGAAFVVAVGVSYTVYVVYDAIDSSKDMARLKKLLELLANADSPEFDRMIQNNRMLDGRN
jgi:ABC-type phosphate transport system permease subunit